MDLSWAAAVFIPTIITPAVLIYISLRILIPKSKAQPNNDFSIIIFFVFVTTLINYDVITYTLRLVWSEVSKVETESKDSLIVALNSLVKNTSVEPVRYSQHLEPLFFNNDIKESNIFGIILELHLRPFLWFLGFYLGLFSFKCYRRRINQYWHNEWSANLLNFVDKVINKLFWNKFKKFFFSYWHYVFDFDEVNESLLVDIMCVDGNLFSGIFVDYTPDDDISRDAIGSVGITCPLKYGPQDDSTTTETIDSNNSTVTKSKIRRPWNIINNEGVMYIPYANIKTIHIWKIRRGTKINLTLLKENHEERMFWYLNLLFNIEEENKGIIKKLKIRIYQTDTYKPDTEKIIEKIMDKIEKSDFSNEHILNIIDIKGIVETSEPKQ